ncbi:MAG TPA: vanadium-dependent haloperoxidase, partial [Steroidobacteraceae bacterium]
MKRTNSFYGLLLITLLGASAPAWADAVTDWNEITVQAVTTGRPGPIGIVDIALVQVAVHDAVQAIEQRFEPYHVELDARPGQRLKGRLSAAVAAAAHDVLVGMYPAQAASLDTTYFNYLADKGLNDDPGIEIGQRVAERTLPLRRVNPDPLPPPFIGGTGVGAWRPTPSFLGNPPSPPPFSPMAASWMAKFDPFTLTSASRFRAPPPPALTSERYARDYDEVKEFGSLVGGKRTAAQTDLAYFYSDNIPAQWNRALRGIATQQLRRSGDTARLFALANLATADALISSWDSKTFYNV